MGLIKTFDIAELRAKLGIKTFVETGTYRGESVDYALSQGYERVITIEINDQYYADAVEKYKNDPRVEILHGDSHLLIHDIAASLQEPALFWLDAHLADGDTSLNHQMTDEEASRNLPLEEELLSIFGRQYKDVIICDDLRLYEDGPYTGGTLAQHLYGKDTQFTISKFHSKTLDTVYEAAKEKFTVKKNFNDQGYLIFLPK